MSKIHWRVSRVANIAQCGAGRLPRAIRQPPIRSRYNAKKATCIPCLRGAIRDRELDILRLKAELKHRR